MARVPCSIITIALFAALAGCSKDEKSADGASAALKPTSGASASAAPSPARPAGPARPTDVSGVRGAPIKSGTAPATSTFVSGKPDGGGYYYNAVFEITNTGKKDITAVAYHACQYLPSGKLAGTPAQNGVDVSVKPGAKATAEVAYTLSELGPNQALGLLIHSVKFADGTNWTESGMVKCPDEVKL